MTIMIVSLLVFGGLLTGCSTTSPFAEAEPGNSYSVEEFGQLVLAEKEAFLENELKNLRTPQSTDSSRVKLSPFILRKYPTLSEWNNMKGKAKPDDRISEFHHRLFGKFYDGPEEAMQRGYALVRQGRVVEFVSVTSNFPSDY